MPIEPANHRHFSIPLPRLLWIGLATAVLVVVAVTMKFGLPIYRQQLAIREIERLGGLVDTRPGGPQWLRDRVGDARMKLLDEVITIHLDSSQVTDAGLAYLKGLTSLQELSLSGTQVTGVGLASLKDLPGLRILWLHGSRVTDAGLAHLNGMVRLRVLWLQDTQITDAGLPHLKVLTSLEEVTLNRTKVTDEGLAELQRALPGLASYR